MYNLKRYYDRIYDLWGYVLINEAVSLVIPFIYKTASEFENGIALVSQECSDGVERFFWINEQGKTLAESRSYKRIMKLKESVLEKVNAEK